ncbi:MAG: Mut7-C RNAse domain-containing protein [Planctomycetota bacterium]|jgi:uncharacterized protein with PIN domain
MKHAEIRFYAELNGFLSPARRGRSFLHAFRGRPSVKDMIEGLGVPHTEVELVLVDGESVDFDRLVEDGERVTVFPVFESIDVSPILRVRPEPLREVRFVLDVHLGRLASYLRWLGFDARYGDEEADEALAACSRDERRILLTRDRGLLKRSTVTHGYCVRGTRPRGQLLEVIRRFDLSRSIAPFRRCPACNGLLESASKEAVRNRLKPGTLRDHDDFRRCTGCRKVYWEGSHFRRMKAFLEAVVEAGRRASREALFPGGSSQPAGRGGTVG